MKYRQAKIGKKTPQTFKEYGPLRDGLRKKKQIRKHKLKLNELLDIIKEK